MDVKQRTSKMKKYILFQYSEYDAAGGLHGITGSFDTIDEAIYEIEHGENRPLDYHDIVDRDTWEIVKEILKP